MDLMGVSELFSSWPSTRTMRCHACSSSSRKRTSEVGDDEQLVRHSALAELAAADTPAAGRARERTLNGLLRGANQILGQPERRRIARQQPFGRLREETLAGAVHQVAIVVLDRRRKAATSISSITLRSSAVASSAPRRWSRSVAAIALTCCIASPSGSFGFSTRARILNNRLRAALPGDWPEYAEARRRGHARRMRNSAKAGRRRDLPSIALSASGHAGPLAERRPRHPEGRRPERAAELAYRDLRSHLQAKTLQPPVQERCG